MYFQRIKFYLIVNIVHHFFSKWDICFAFFSCCILKVISHSFLGTIFFFSKTIIFNSCEKMGPREPPILELQELSEQKVLQLCLHSRSCKSLEFNVDDETFSSFLLLTVLCLFQVEPRSQCDIFSSSSHNTYQKQATGLSNYIYTEGSKTSII